jgi:hypothetical protein
MDRRKDTAVEADMDQLIMHGPGLNKEVKRRADVVGIFPNEASIRRLIGVVLFEQNDEWQTLSRNMMVAAFRPDRQGGDRPHSQLNHESRLNMPSGRLEIYSSLTDVTVTGAPRPRTPSELRYSDRIPESRTGS